VLQQFVSQTPNITGFSTALFSTWIFVEDFGVLFDAGDGVSAGLLQKSRKIHRIAITHPDRDHVAGLLQLQQLNARDGLPEILYPADCGSFPALAAFCRQFDPGRGDQLTWTPVKPGDQPRIAKNLKLKVIANDHFPEKKDLIKSVSYILVRENRKLKKEFAGLDSKQLAEISRNHDQGHLSEIIDEPLVGYSGDTGVTTPDRWLGCKTLIHEATFLNQADAGERADRHQHSILPDVLKMASVLSLDHLILSHFSSRYSTEEIRHAILSESANLKLRFPVFAILPGEIGRNILNNPPVFAP
jgi:ribonuclease Z